MSTIALILFVIAVLSTRWYLQHRRSQVAAAASQRGLHFSPDHTWLRVDPDGLVTVGASDLAASFAGQLVSVDLPDRGAQFQRSDEGWTFTSERGRILTQEMPVSGEVVAVNEEVTRDPRLVQLSPFEDGWLVRLRPRNLESGLRRLRYGREARTWLEAVRDRVMAVVSPEMGVVAQDGGEWIPGFGDAMDDELWEKLRLELFAPSEAVRTIEPTW